MGKLIGILFVHHLNYELHLLPLHKNDSILTYYGVVDFDTSQNLLLTSNGDSIYTLENIATGKHKEFILSGLEFPFTVPEYHFIQGGIYFKWRYWYQELIGLKSGTREKTFCISH